MKKTLLILLIIFLVITGCKTQEEIQEEKEKERIDEITKEVEKNTELPDEVKTWLVDNKSKKVLTIFCQSVSKRCETIKEDVKAYEKNIKIYYVDFYEMDENIKDAYKSAYGLENYTGYLPYVLLVNNNKVVDTLSNIKGIDEIKEMLIKNKIIS